LVIAIAPVSTDVLALLDHHLLDVAGTYGDPNAGDPIQYDGLRIEHGQRDVEIVVYNRAVLLFTTDREAVRRIYQVCCRLDDCRRATPSGLVLAALSPVLRGLTSGSVWRASLLCYSSARMTESEQRKRLPIVVAVVVPFSLALAVGAYYFVRTGQYLMLAQSPWCVMMGVFLMFNAVFLGTRAVRAQDWPHEWRLIFFLFATSSLLFGLASCVNAFGARLSAVHTLVQMAIGVWVIRFAVHVFSGLRWWRQKRGRLG